MPASAESVTRTVAGLSEACKERLLSPAGAGFLRKLGIPYENHLRFPLTVTECDFVSAHHVVAIKERGHRPMIERDFPQWLDRVEFWHVHDLDCCGLGDAIPQLDREVDALIGRLTCAE